ncbi:MAG: sugar ABC transporter ATP-binding protein [Planctomycetota bacterium]|nr:sugar ABC transporter ATP-binding protein [Planctomycetota bacterium]
METEGHHETTPLIAIDHITKRFPGVVALDDVCFDVVAGEFHAIVGENGAGKSTLMKVLAGVWPDFEGRLILRGEPRHFTGTRDAEAHGISIIHQELNLVEQLSVAANIFLGREQTSRLGFLQETAMTAAADALLRELECDISPTAQTGDLRIGDQQLVEIAKALSLEADILIMDEPTSALTESEVARLFRVIDRLQSRGVTILYISHKMEEVFQASNRITVLRDGKHVRTLNTVDTNPREITHLMVGREIENMAIGDDRTPGETLLKVESLSLPWTGHARQWRLRDISFELRRGEVLGVAGLMGAGRTELMECLFGTSVEPPLGTILLKGEAVDFHSPREARRAGIGLVTEDRKRLGLFSQMTVRENITICTLVESVTAGLVSMSRERAAANESMDLLGVKSAGIEAGITSLSGGNQQKCVIARWLRTNPDVLLLDDPTRGIDVGAKAEIYKVIDQLCHKGLGIMVTSSELPELITLCDRILVLCEGRLTGEFTRGEFTEQALMEAATRREVTVV